MDGFVPTVEPAETDHRMVSCCWFVLDGNMERKRMTMYDIIIGAGPAGISAGIYAVSRGKRTLILEKAQVGGISLAKFPLLRTILSLRSRKLELHLRLG